MICGLSPANAVEDISEKINNLVTTVKSTSIESKDDPSAPHLKQVNEVARAVISSAPEFVSTGSLGVGSDVCLIFAFTLPHPPLLRRETALFA